MPSITKIVRFSRWAALGAMALPVLIIGTMAAPKLFSSDKLLDEFTFALPILLWNMAPAALGHTLLRGAETRAGWGSIAFAVSASGTTFYIYGAYMLMALGVIRASSTEVLGLFILPAYQLAFAGIIAAVVVVLVFLKERFFTRKT